MQQHLSLLLLLVTATGSPALGSVIGQLQLRSTGGQVVLTQTSIDWLTGIGSVGDGVVQVGGGSSKMIYGDNTRLLPGTLGRIKDIDGPIAEFLSFPDLPGGGPIFRISSYSAGVSDANCHDDKRVGDTCSPLASLPLVFIRADAGLGKPSTVVTFAAYGNAFDATPDITRWYGAFTMQIIGRTPGEVQDLLAAGGSISCTYSGQITAYADTPESGTLPMFLAGVLFVSLGRGLRVLRARHQNPSTSPNAEIADDVESSQKRPLGTF